LVCRDEGDCHAEQGDLRAHSRRRHGRPSPGQAMSGSSKRARAVVGDRRRSAPHAGWLLRLTAIRCSGSRSWPLPRWPVLRPVARFGPVRRAGRGRRLAACVRGSALRRFRSPARHAGHDQIPAPRHES
jgi:hypothetical protein